MILEKFLNLEDIMVGIKVDRPITYLHLLVLLELIVNEGKELIGGSRQLELLGLVLP